MTLLTQSILMILAWLRNKLEQLQIMITRQRVKFSLLLHTHFQDSNTLFRCLEKEPKPFLTSMMMETKASMMNLEKFQNHQSNILLNYRRMQNF